MNETWAFWHHLWAFLLLWYQIIMKHTGVVFRNASKYWNGLLETRMFHKNTLTMVFHLPGFRSVFSFLPTTYLHIRDANFEMHFNWPVWSVWMDFGMFTKWVDPNIEILRTWSSQIDSPVTDQEVKSEMYFENIVKNSDTVIALFEIGYLCYSNDNFLSLLTSPLSLAEKTLWGNL